MRGQARYFCPLRKIVPMNVLNAAAIFFFATASCNTPKGTAQAPSAKVCPCPKDIMCTEDFRFVTLRINDASGKPVLLDRYETVRASNNTVLARADNTTMDAGTYVIASDGEKESISTCGEKFFFRGYKGGKKVVDEPYTLRNDCCHVERQSGRAEAQL